MGELSGVFRGRGFRGRKEERKEGEAGMRWGDLGESGGPARGDRPSVRGSQCSGHSPWPPPIATPDSQARTVTALYT